MRFMKFTMLALLGILLAACSRYHGHYGGKYYQKNAQATAPLKIPHGIASPVADQYYSVPWKAQAGSHAKLSLLPPDPEYKRVLRTIKLKKKKAHK